MLIVFLIQDYLESGIIGIYENQNDIYKMLEKEFNNFKKYYLYDDHEVKLMNYKDSLFENIPLQKYKFEKYIIYEYQKEKYNFSNYININPINVYIFEMQI